MPAYLGGAQIRAPLTQESERVVSTARGGNDLPATTPKHRGER
jgi:hypothetical protein